MNSESTEKKFISDKMCKMCCMNDPCLTPCLDEGNSGELGI